jgi:curved DNA-binding protein CbpA
MHRDCTGYRKVIRQCHPDKHMDLPPGSGAFLELQKVFTALCEAYKLHKSSAGGT